MGKHKFSVLCNPLSTNCFRVISTSSEKQKTVQVENLDGKIVEFTRPVLVKEVIGKFPCGSIGIGLSKKAEKHLPLSYELKLGKVYYALPASLSSPSYSPGVGSITRLNQDHGLSSGSGGIKRIKVVITKQKLQELLSKQVSIHDVVVSAAAVGVKVKCRDDDSFPYGKIKLQSIPEENEM